ncbi:MAG TPA: bifunctional DNA primase/polymerase [Casimicrobiaceae bacterium]|nr:bifunctional DNA primase/polymerase [Casimicrobiaceae bacterium]
MRSDTEVRSPAPGAPASTAGAKAGSRTPYADAARDLYQRGLFPIPCEGDDGKKPCGVQRWQRMKRPPPETVIERLVKEHAAANVGVVMGASSACTVVDVDDPAQVDEIRERCGETPLVTRTPSGGVHLWYRHDGERCPNIRRFGLNADVKGQGGMIVVPPSFNRLNGRSYDFEVGSWDDLSRLPKIRPGALDLVTPRGSRSDSASILAAVAQGQRNAWLFRAVMHFAVQGADLDTILNHARTCNSTCDPPLPEEEVRRVAESAWKMTARGDNWIGREQRVILNPE